MQMRCVALGTHLIVLNNPGIQGSLVALLGSRFAVKKLPVSVILDKDTDDLWSVARFRGLLFGQIPTRFGLVRTSGMISHDDVEPPPCQGKVRRTMIL